MRSAASGIILIAGSFVAIIFVYTFAAYITYIAIALWRTDVFLRAGFITHGHLSLLAVMTGVRVCNIRCGAREQNYRRHHQ